jgi:hypothetical protein
LIDRQPVVLLGPVEIDDLSLGAGNPVLQDRIAVSGVRALAAIDVERDPGPVPESIAQALQPAERGLFGVRLGEAAAHRLAHRWSDKHTLLRAWRRRAGVLLLGA